MCPVNGESWLQSFDEWATATAGRFSLRCREISPRSSVRVHSDSTTMTTPFHNEEQHWLWEWTPAITMLVGLALLSWMVHALAAWGFAERDQRRDREQRWSKFEAHVTRSKQKQQEQQTREATSRSSSFTVAASAATPQPRRGPPRPPTPPTPPSPSPAVAESVGSTVTGTGSRRSELQQGYIIF